MKSIIKKDIAIVIQNFIQFQSIKSGIDDLIARGKSIDIYVPEIKDKDGYGNMFDDFYENISKYYSTSRKSNENIEYKILLEPYITESYFKLKYTYRIKYKYSTISAKPNPVYKPELNLCYDGIICFGEYEANYISAYAKPLVIENIKYKNFVKKPNNKKPILLYLPTFGEHSYIEEFLSEIDEIKKEYEVVVKLHHGTSFLISEIERAKKLKQKSDRYYDQNTALATLLSEANVVLSDNSGSIFEAIYANVPVAIFAKEINDTRLEKFDTTQYVLVKKKIIPYTDNSKKIMKILKQATSSEFVKKQNDWRKYAFSLKNVKENNFAEKIEKYLNDDEEIIRYKNIHDVLKKEYYCYKNEIIEKQNYILSQNKRLEELTNLIQKQENDINNEKMILTQEIEKINDENKKLVNNITDLEEKNSKYIKNINILNETIYNLNSELEIYKNSKLYIIAEKIYKVINKIRRKE